MLYLLLFDPVMLKLQQSLTIDSDDRDTTRNKLNAEWLSAQDQLIVPKSKDSHVAVLLNFS